MKAKLALLVSFFTLTASAVTLPTDHFLYPSDVEIAFLAGALGSVSENFAKRLLVKCADGTVDPKYTDHCRAADWIKKGSAGVADFPWEKMTAQVLYFGEMHLGQESKQFLTAHMRDLKLRGYGAFAMEMFNSKHQPELDRYNRGELSREEIKAVLRTGWNYDSEGYLDAMEAAKAEGMRVLALDDRGIPWKNDWFLQLQERDEHMAKILAGWIAREPELKIAVLCGRMHAFGVFSEDKLNFSQPALMREKYGITTQSMLVYSTLEPGDSGFNAMQKAIFGPGVPTIMLPPSGYAYGDIFMFLRDPKSPAVPSWQGFDKWRPEYLDYVN